MIPTLHGIVTLALGLLLWHRGQLLLAVCTVLALGLFESSAALVLPALSGSSIPPARLMLGFVLVIALSRLYFRAPLFREVVSTNAALIVFCLYGLIGAFLLPRIFQGTINVVPMRPAGLRHVLDTFPLGYSAQNVTTSFYVLGSGLAALAAYTAGRLTEDVSPLVKTAIAVGFAHAIIGVLGVVLKGTPWDDVVAFIRNGSYSQLSQATQSYVRIAGFMAEPSNFARFGLFWMVFNTELWLRDIMPRGTGAAALGLAIILTLSTSSTAYVGLAGYALLLGLRFATIPSYLRTDKVVTILVLGVLAAIAGLALVLTFEQVAAQFTDMFRSMTVDKADSLSGKQRMFWAMQGFDAFAASWGLGIGAGSFRSSSIATAIIGSMGIVGACSFVYYCASLFLRRAVKTGVPAEALRIPVARACCWAAICGLIPMMLMAGSPDPGMEFAIFAGLSLAFRRPSYAQTESFSSDGSAWRPVASGAPVAARIRPPAVPRSGGWRMRAK